MQPAGPAVPGELLPLALGSAIRSSTTCDQTHIRLEELDHHERPSSQQQPQPPAGSTQQPRGPLKRLGHAAW